MDISIEEDSSQNSRDFGASTKVCSGALPESLGAADGRLFYNYYFIIIIIIILIF